MAGTGSDNRSAEGRFRATVASAYCASEEEGSANPESEISSKKQSLPERRSK